MSALATPRIEEVHTESRLIDAARDHTRNYTTLTNVTRLIGQERLGLAERGRAISSLDTLVSMIDWRPVVVLLDRLYPAVKGELPWPPLAMFKALLLSVWYDLSDVKLAEALDDRAFFRRFCEFSANEATPERTAFVRFRRLNDGKAGPDALPDNPGEVFADSAYRGSHFRDAVRGKGGIPRIIATGTWGRDEAETLRKLHAWNQPIHRRRGRIEKIFGTWKRCYRLHRMRWRGLAKAAVKVHLTAIAYNLKRTINILTVPA